MPAGDPAGYLPNVKKSRTVGNMFKKNFPAGGKKPLNIKRRGAMPKNVQGAATRLLHRNNRSFRLK